MSKPEPCALLEESRIRLDPEERNPQLGRFHEMMQRMVIGQPTAIETITNSFSRVLAGISDPERPILTMLQHAKCIKELQIIDALNHPEHIMAALDGNHVGTIIYKH